MFNKIKSEDRVRALLGCLARALDRELKRATSSLHQLLDVPGEVNDLVDVLIRLKRVRTSVGQLGSGPCPAGFELMTRIRSFSSDLLDVLKLLRRERYEARRTVTRALNLLIAAETELADVVGEASRREGARRIVISSALLFQAHFSLFPAERMLLGSARTAGRSRILNGLYYVTGRHHSSHVQADPALLSKALITMEASEIFLLAWLHPHPGKGAGATWPSGIDLRQHQDWICDYSPDLLSAIMVADGHVRFWGTALEQRRTILNVVGPGVERTEEENVYRLVH